MKRVIKSVLVSAFCLLPSAFCTGCADSKWSFLRNSRDQARLPDGAPAADKLVAYLNLNAQRLQTLQCRDLDLDIKQKLQSWGLRGKMVCQQLPARPDAAGVSHTANFRLVAESLGNKVVDLGSNDQEFWYWISKSDPPWLVHCAYQDMARGVKMPFPFQPEWIMEALGMAECGPADQFTVRPGGDRKTLELVQQTINSQGQPVQKVTVFNRQHALPPVLAHVLRDAKGKDICAAHIREVQVVQGAIVPKKVVLRWPDEGLELTMRLDEVAVNQTLDRDQATLLFTRPVMANVQSYDLARGLEPAGTQVRPAGGFGR